MFTSILKFVWPTVVLIWFCVVAVGVNGPESQNNTNGNSEFIEKDSEPVIIGYGEGLFVIGEELYSNTFENGDDWVIQIQDSDAEMDPEVNFSDDSMDVLMPGRGATIWNRNKFNGPIAITFNVKAQTENVHIDGIVVRDINTFWHASDPEHPEAIFNQELYNGAFDSYHRQQGYYASMGGRDNTTTRFRRYPRTTTDGEPVKHISLSERDGLEDFLIQPDRTHAIQLVVYQDVIQYIVDGRIFYEIREGDTITISTPDGGEKTAEYTEDLFPLYSDGWFGFRLVNTHHNYSDFRVHRLKPAE